MNVKNLNFKETKINYIYILKYNIILFRLTYIINTYFIQCQIEYI